MNKFEIHQFICRADNYGVLVSDKNSGLTMSVDAPDACLLYTSDAADE